MSFAPYTPVYGCGSDGDGAKNLLYWFDRESVWAGTCYNLGVCACLAGETLVTTTEGDVPISELAGTAARVLTLDVGGERHSPKWVDAEFKSYGEQALRRITLRRGNDVRVIHATPEHRWITRTRKRHSDGGGDQHHERTTDELSAGDRIPTVFPRSGASRVRHHFAGVPHGLVYGDGTTDSTGGSRIALYGDKMAHAEFFPNVPSSFNTNPLGTPYCVITGLSRTWKSLPSPTESSAYLYGFLAGWFAADGRVGDDGYAQLYCTDREALEAARVIARSVGISTYPIRETKSGGNEVAGRWVDVGVIYSISFVSNSLDSSFFLNTHHRERWSSATRRQRPPSWTVVSVEATDRFEEVFCAEVPDTENFVLAEGVLTGNCRGTGSGATSQHARCRAGDIGIPMLPGGRPNRAVGDAVVAALVDTAERLGVTEIIWNRRRWSANTPYGAPYGGVSPHYDHVHFALSLNATRYLNVPTVRSVMAGTTTPAPPPPGTPPPPTTPFVPPGGPDVQFFISDPAYGIRLVITDGNCVLDYGVTKLAQLDRTGTRIGGPMTPAEFARFCSKYPGGRFAMGHLPA